MGSLALKALNRYADSLYVCIYIYICDKIHYSLEKPLVLGGNMPKEQSRGFASLAKKAKTLGRVEGVGFQGLGVSGCRGPKVFGCRGFNVCPYKYI